MLSKKEQVALDEAWVKFKHFIDNHPYYKELIIKGDFITLKQSVMRAMAESDLRLSRDAMFYMVRKLHQSYRT